MSKEREILQMFQTGMSQRNIALGLHVSRNTVAKVVAAYKSTDIPNEMFNAIDDDELHRKLYPNEVPGISAKMPDYGYVHKELLKAGVTLRLLWEEYTSSCRSTGQLCIQYSQFCKLYRDYADRHHLTMHIRHKPGDKMMVDWAGKCLQLHNPETGAVSKAYIFVGTLQFSMYCFAEAFPDMKEESWINANIHMVQFFGGATRLLMPDNLKTGMVSNRKHEDPVGNQSYKEFEILKKYQKASLLVLDEFLLIPADDNQQRILLELLERRYGRASTIFCSQFSPEGWHDQLGGSAIADSILDRITPNSYTISIHEDVSMRQRLSEND